MCTQTAVTIDPVRTIDVTPTWGEVGIFYFRIVDSREFKAEAHLRSEIARALAFAQALNAIYDTLTEDQMKVVKEEKERELAKLKIVCREKG